MQAITIAEQLWLEPTMLGATLNFAEQVNGLHFRVGISFRSLGECDKALRTQGTTWMLQDKSLMVRSSADLTLTFCPGTELERKLVLSGDELETFKHAIRFLTLAFAPQNN
jgi:hypothetical protein